MDQSNSFAGIAVVPTNATKSAHVAFGASKAAAFEDYKHKLATVERDVGTLKEDFAEVTEVLVVELVHVDELYVAFIAEGEKYVFEVLRDSFPAARMLQPGDVVEVTYVASDSTIAQVSGFRNITIDM